MAEHISCYGASARKDVRKWAVAMTHPAKEALAEQHLARQQLESYCPRTIKRIRKGRRFENVIRPLFPGYLFVRVEPQRQHWRPILSTFGVRTLVHFGDQIGLIDDRFVACLKAREVNGVVVRSAPIAEPSEAYRPGQQVQLNGGPFDGAVVTILSVEEKDRLLVLLDLLEHGVRTKVCVDQVIPISDRQAA